MSEKQWLRIFNKFTRHIQRQQSYQNYYLLDRYKKRKIIIFIEKKMCRLTQVTLLFSTEANKTFLIQSPSKVNNILKYLT